MAGIRLHHPTFSSCTFVVELPTQMPRTRDCPSCGRIHEHKAVHLRLDSHGDVIVSKEVLALLKQVFLAGMEVVNEIENPPPQVLGAVDQPKYESVLQPLNRQNGQRFWTPGTDKYVNRDKIQKAVSEALKLPEGEVKNG